MRRILIGLCVACWVAGAGGVQAQDDPKAVIEKAVKAMGGVEKLSKYPAAQMKTKGAIELMGMTVPFEGEISYQEPGQFKMQFVMDVMGQKFNFAQGLNKDKGWMSLMGQTQELQGDELAKLKSEAYASRVEALVPVLLDKNKEFTLSLVGEGKVNGKPATGVKVSSKAEKDINLYFDRETGFLVKSERRALDPSNAEVNQESFYSDYKETAGIKTAMKYLVHHDGKKFLEGEATEIKYHEKLDDSVFSKP
jgi:hypothetical protein